MDTLRSLLENAEYEVKVVSYGDYCVAYYPPKLEKPVFDAEEVKYDVGSLAKTQKKYAVRPLILIDISKCCLLRNYNPGLILFLIGETQIEEYEFLKSLNLDLTPEEEEKEDILYKMLGEAYTEGFSDTIMQEAKKNGIEKEVLFAKNMLGLFLS